MKHRFLCGCLLSGAALLADANPGVGFATVDRPARKPVQELVDAAGTGDSTTVKRLLDAQVDVNAATPKTGATALHQAAANGHASLVTLLIERGAVVDARDIDDATPLVYAAYHGRAPIIGLLVAAKADVAFRPERQVHALNAALMSGSIDTVKALVAAGADPDLDDVYGKDARAYAAQLGRGDLAALLPEASAVATEETAP